MSYTQAGKQESLQRGQPMAVRQSRYLSKSGKRKWVCNYTDQLGKRHEKTFATKKLADAFWSETHSEMLEGIHTPDSEAPTLDGARDTFIRVLKEEGSARSTVANHESNYRVLIQPALGKRRINRIAPADVQKMLDDLRRVGRSAHALGRAKKTLGAILDEAIRQGRLVTNPVRSLRQRRRSRRAIIAQGAAEQVVIPQKEEVRVIVDAAGAGQSWVIVRERLEGRGWQTIYLADVPPPIHVNTALSEARRLHTGDGRVMEAFTTPAWLRPMVVTLAFTGLRIGEVRALSWPNIDLEGGFVHVEQAVDQFNTLGSLKTMAARRTVPVGPFVINTLRSWKEVCPTSGLELVFPSRRGTPISYRNILQRNLHPLWIRLGQTDSLGNPRYTPHCFRHFSVSLWVEQGATPHQVAKWVGHEDPGFTMRLYAHLFEQKAKERDRIAAAELDVMGGAALA